ncbi:AlpA family transcriptional regulator [Caballeronia sp. SBC2]|uniref:helix-turn-helix transcriptional regulator n=1 Tax=Caballeronia sp. SBC2 TaxID=2705547 RepID=UPI0013E9B832|nr:AlpA family phage regulatory protein [Caballeronia sp. SBC2]
MPETGFIRPNDLLPILAIKSRKTLERWIRTGRFPQPVQIGERAIGWHVGVVRAWIAERNPPRRNERCAEGQALKQHSTPQRTLKCKN